MGREVTVEVPLSPAREMSDVIASRISERASTMSLSGLSSPPVSPPPPGVSGGEGWYGGGDRGSLAGLGGDSGGTSAGLGTVSGTMSGEMKPAFVDRIRVSDSASPSMIIRMLGRYDSQIFDNRNWIIGIVLGVKVGSLESGKIVFLSVRV